MPKTTGDLLFERYLKDHGYDPGPHEPDLSSHGIAKRPDFLPRKDGSTIACEVEQFRPGASAIERRLVRQRTATASAAEALRPIRKRVEGAAKQLKPLQGLGLPLVVVLANPDGAMIDLSVEHVLAALFGDPTYRIKIDPETGAGVGGGQFEFGRNGKLTNDHPYLSAIVLLRRGEHRRDRIAEIAAQEREDSPSTFDEATTAAMHLLQRLDAEDLPEGDYTYVETIETVSPTAVPLPADWFSGARDTRWRLSDEGFFERTSP